MKEVDKAGESNHQEYVDPKNKEMTDQKAAYMLTISVLEMTTQGKQLMAESPASLLKYNFLSQNLFSNHKANSNIFCKIRRYRLLNSNEPYRQTGEIQL